MNEAIDIGQNRSNWRLLVLTGGVWLKEEAYVNCLAELCADFILRQRNISRRRFPVQCLHFFWACGKVRDFKDCLS